MLRCSALIVCFVVLRCAEISTARGIPKYNFSISSLYNQSGIWYAEKIQLDHEGENLWNVIVNYTSDDLKNSQSILIVDNKISPTCQVVKTPEVIKHPRATGYELIPGLGYYKVHSEAKSWNSASDTCREEGAHLYIFNSKMEAEAVDAVVVKSSTGRRNYWIGIHDQYKEGDYVTIFNETFHRVDSLVWRVDSREDQDCGYLCYSSSNYCFDDEMCTTTISFICEIEI